jgi:hypothetical protein
MRVPEQIAITDVIFGGEKRLVRSGWSPGGSAKWFVYGGIHSTSDKLTPLPSFSMGKTAVTNVHITVPVSDDTTSLENQVLIRASNFHVTFVFAGSVPNLRYEYREERGKATLTDQDGRTLVDLGFPKKLPDKNLIVQDGYFQTSLGKKTNWTPKELREAADRVAAEFYTQYYY